MFQYQIGEQDIGENSPSHERDGDIDWAAIATGALDMFQLVQALQRQSRQEPDDPEPANVEPEYLEPDNTEFDYLRTRTRPRTTPTSLFGKY